jgi:hypothetical protein
MANSARHKKLTSRISFIESELLPPIKLSGNYTKKESDLIRSYVILSHAEIESYFEDIASEVVTRSLQAWITSRRRSTCLLSIMTFCGEDIKWENRNDKNTIESRIRVTAGHYINLLKSNHGVKSKNILKILLPIGIEESSLDQTWLTIMDEFGKKRGSFAHSSHIVQAQIDLKTEKDRLNRYILPEIKTLDLLIKKIR